MNVMIYDAIFSLPYTQRTEKTRGKVKAFPLAIAQLEMLYDFIILVRTHTHIFKVIMLLFLNVDGVQLYSNISDFIPSSIKLFRCAEVEQLP